MDGVYVKNSPGKGRGVFAKTDIPKGTRWTALGIKIVQSDTTNSSILHNYVFQGPSLDTGVLILDTESLMNHVDSPNCNIDYSVLDNNSIEYVASQDIHKDEELLIDYGYDPESHNKSTYDIKKWNDITIGQFDNNLEPSQGGVELKSIMMDIKDDLEDADENTKKAFNVVTKYLGQCPTTGCIEQDSDGFWRIISNRTSKYWPQKYKDEDAAKAALRAYHAHH